MVHSQQVCGKVLFRVDTGTQHSGAENRLIITWSRHSINVNFSLCEAESVLRSKGTLVDVADGNTSFVATDTSSARNSTEANELCFNHVTVIVNTKNVVCGVPALFAFTHFGGQCLASCRNTAVPDTSYASVALAQGTVPIITKKCRELRLLLFLFFLTFL